ncbi:MAG TPA: hypothetical protein VL992_12595 [Tepidisphaeraceae bacterium]|nr:hypothetical protein [Tepidisphaeraceae bacterium]
MRFDVRFGAVAVAAVVLLFVSKNATANNNLLMLIQVTGTPSQTYYSAALSPLFFPDSSLPQGLQFQNGLISSSDGQYIAQTTPQGDWELIQPTFTNFGSFLSSLEQPWSIVLDAGLPTQHTYAMTLNLGNLPATNVIPPIVTFPTNQSIISASESTFTFSPPGLNVPISLQFSYLPNHATSGAFVFEDQLSLPAGSSSWTAPTPLLTDTDYDLDLSVQNIFPSNFGFSDPVDSNSNTIPDWSSEGNLSFDSNVIFSTALPEPRVALLTLFLAPILGRRSRRFAATLR